MIFKKKTIREIYIKKAHIFKHVPRPEVANLFGVIPCSYYLMSISRTRYYEYKKLGLKVVKVEAGGLSDYYVRVNPTREVEEKDFLMILNLPIRFTLYQYNDKKAKLYFSKDDIGKTRFSK